MTTSGRRLRGMGDDDSNEMPRRDPQRALRAWASVEYLVTAIVARDERGNEIIADLRDDERGVLGLIPVYRRREDAERSNPHGQVVAIYVVESGPEIVETEELKVRKR